MSTSPKRAKVDVDDVKDRFRDLFDLETPSVEDVIEPLDTSVSSRQHAQSDSVLQALEAELQQERDLRLRAEQRLSELEQERELWQVNQKRLHSTEQQNAQLQAQVTQLTNSLESAQKKLLEGSAGVETFADVEVDVEHFLTMLKAKQSTRANGTSHYVCESVDEWLEQTKDEFTTFGRSRGPNESQYYWNMGTLLLIRGLSRIPDWQDRVRALAYSPDLALAEIWKLALMGLAKPN